LQLSFFININLVNKNIYLYIMFIGLDNNSWGYHSDDGNFFFCGNYNEYGYNDYGPSFTTGDTIGCCLNFRNNTVFFTKNGVNLGSYYF
jgi:Ran-binding protein 9/10